MDTIVCMDGTEVVGTFLTEEIQRDGIMGTTNQHETVYVISPEINSNNQMLFRDNNKAAINGKHAVSYTHLSKFAVNPNAVRNAYQELEEEGYVCDQMCIRDRMWTGW